MKSRRRKAKISNTLVYFDEPQLVTLSGSRNNKWIAVAVNDIDDFKAPFFCVRIKSHDLQKYFEGKVDLLNLFKFSSTREYMCFDYGDISVENGEVYLNPIIPQDDFFPEEGFFSREHTEDIDFSKEGLSPSEESEDSYNVRIDGNWELPEFSSFGEKMSTVYSFLHSIRTLECISLQTRQETISKLENTFSDHPWEGGFSYVHFYRDLYESIPQRDRLNVDKIQYASPGFIKLDGNRNTFDDLDDALNSMQKNYYNAHEKYSNLYQILRKSDLLRARHDEQTPTGTLQLQKIVADLLTAICNDISLRGLENIYKSCEENWITTAKIVMSYFRRLKKLFVFYSEGRAHT
ncbi:hypothetical protein MSKU15_1987 [Komagataeibacter diospyri]|uniref:hypothetical protein n=1 Tax=Komagataeibacter diospyri TaxID=1932662 RepID=UPI00113670F2|nr:hypothetical protein [Komagataeibacter diospyri]GCE90386.1 hypothetical protein MSKU15_1987 [Komagataeibacter diospyri]